MKIYAYVGNWGFGAGNKGISTYEYHPESGKLTLIETICPEIAAGQLCVDRKRGILYACNEIGERRGEVGGGGYLLSFKIDGQSGKLTRISEKETLCPEPSYVTLDVDGQYLLVSHCADPWHVTKIEKDEEGHYRNRVLFDDACVALLEVGEDGRIGRICDVSITESTDGKNSRSEVSIDPFSGHMQLVEVLSRLHCVVSNPDGTLYAVCDKGMDRVYTYKLLREEGRLLQMDCYQADFKVFPRYAAFHPTLDVLYVNNEFDPSIYAFSYDRSDGKLSLLGRYNVVSGDLAGVDVSQAKGQDIQVAPDGQTLYCTFTGMNTICVFSLDGNGIPALRQQIPVRGDMPRGLAFSPEGRYLYSGNMLSSDITMFTIGPDGLLSDSGVTIEAVSPSAIRFYVPESV